MNKIPKFTHVYRKGNYVLLFNSLTLEKHYLHKKDYPKLFKNEILIKKGLVIKKNFDEDEYFNKIKKGILKHQKEPRIALCYLLLTGDCNYGCEYCFIETNIRKKTYMGPETARKAINFFKKNVSPQAKTKKIYFYGGEPLLNFPALKAAVEEVKTSIPDARLIIITNGALVTEKIAKFLIENKVSVSFSIDGPKHINDKVRITYKKKDGSFDLTLRGFNIFKSLGLTPSISCTIGPHNMNDIEIVMNYFINELGIRGIDFNLIKPVAHKSIPGVKKLTKQMIRGFEIARVNGLRVPRLEERKIKPFVTKKPWIKDCAGYGQQIIVTPEGEVGPCHAFWPLNKFLDLTVDSDTEVTKHDTWKDWNRRTAYNEPRCKYCVAISLCGGGCAFHHYNEKEGIWNLDKTTCEFTKEILKWLVWAYFEHKYYEEINFENKKIIIKLPSWTDNKRYNSFLKKVKNKELQKIFPTINSITESVYEDKIRLLFVLNKTELIGVVYGNMINHVFLEEYENNQLIAYVSEKLKKLNQLYLTGETKENIFVN